MVTTESHANETFYSLRRATGVGKDTSKSVSFGAVCGHPFLTLDNLELIIDLQGTSQVIRPTCHVVDG